jgi:2-oxoglutarate ferredoxin oxidoreductase subunit gamma
MRHEIRFSGFGGQGIILSAVIVGRAAALHDDKFAVQTQVYGPEARGGASMSAVIIDEEPILYPKVRNPDIFVIMSQEGFLRYGADSPPDATMILDTDMVQGRPPCTWYGIPATSEAKRVLGKVIVANIVMIGALVGATHVVSEEAIEKAVRESVPRGTEDLNLRALRRGVELAAEVKRST